MTAQDREWLRSRNVEIGVPGVHFGLDEADHSKALRSFLARPFLPDYFPGHDVYLWIDSDVWLQDVTVLDTYIDGALQAGFAIAHETDPGYRFQAWLLGWTAKHFLLGYGAATALWLLSRDHLNAGLFAARSDAPQWALWARCYEAAIRRTGALVPHDQFALNHALHRNRGLAAFLDPGCNWICDRGAPMWNDALGAFCKPYPPYAPIGALHLAGPAKRRTYTVGRTEGSSFETFIVHGARPDHPVLAVPLETAAAVSLRDAA
jgi:hypothetical protein